MNLIEWSSIADQRVPCSVRTRSPLMNQTLVGRVTPCTPSQPCRMTNEGMAVVRTREAFWTAAALCRFFDGLPKIEFHQTAAATLTGSWSA